MADDVPDTPPVPPPAPPDAPVVVARWAQLVLLPLALLALYALAWTATSPVLAADRAPPAVPHGPPEAGRSPSAPVAEPEDGIPVHADEARRTSA